MKLLLNGTNFQIKVWEALLRIPTGSVVTYEDIALSIGMPKAARQETDGSRLGWFVDAGLYRSPYMMD